MGRYSVRKGTQPKGFTLIELLVVIAIIGLLSSVVLAALTVARSKSYDAKRFSDLKQMQTAIEAYYADHGSYPSPPAGSTGTPPRDSDCGSPWSPVIANNNHLIPSLISGGYISSIPEAPQTYKTGHVDCYVYASDGINYKFEDYQPDISPATGATPSGPLADPAETHAWAVYSPGGSSWL